MFGLWAKKFLITTKNKFHTCTKKCSVSPLRRSLYYYLLLHSPGGNKTAFWTNGEENSSWPSKKISLNGEKCTCLGFSSPNFPGFFLFFPDFFPIKAILQLLGRKSQNWVIITLSLHRARAKNWGRKQVSLTAGVGKKTGFVARILTGGKWLKMLIFGPKICKNRENLHNISLIYFKRGEILSVITWKWRVGKYGVIKR